MSTVFSYTNSKGQNTFWPGIQYAGKIHSYKERNGGLPVLDDVMLHEGIHAISCPAIRDTDSCTLLVRP